MQLSGLPNKRGHVPFISTRIALGAPLHATARINVNSRTKADIAPLLAGRTKSWPGWKLDGPGIVAGYGYDAPINDASSGIRNPNYDNIVVVKAIQTGKRNEPVKGDKRMFRSIVVY
jgi:hypothetical protein